VGVRPLELVSFGVQILTPKGDIACGPPSPDGTPGRLRRARNQSADRCGSQQRPRSAALFLAREPPDLAEVREALDCVISETYRAADILGGIQEQIKKAPPRQESFDLSEAIRTSD
jgi:hypothetical protein